MATSLPSLPPLTGDTSWIDNPTGMQGLPVPVAPARPSATTSGTTSSTWSDWPPKASSAPGSTSGGILTAGTNLVKKLAAGTLEAYIGRSLEDVIFIVIGLILVAAAVFTFKDVQGAVQSVQESSDQAAKQSAKYAASSAAFETRVAKAGKKMARAKEVAERAAEVAA
jgi:hypothetical protein